MSAWVEDLQDELAAEWFEGGQLAWEVEMREREAILAELMEAEFRERAEELQPALV
jgi:hypothetical protein